MSYDIIKNIKVKDGKVFICCASNNVSPKTYEDYESKRLTETLATKGQDEVDYLIMKEYESGNFQRGNNKYTRALKVLLFTYGEEYKKFNWRVLSCEDRRKVEDSDEFKALLMKALKTYLPKQKFFVFKRGYNYYVRKVSSRHIFYGNESQKKLFDFRIEAERIAKQIDGEVRELLNNDTTPTTESERFIKQSNLLIGEKDD